MNCQSDPRKGRFVARCLCKGKAMFRNYLAAALRNIARSRFYAAISILGLAVGLTAAIVVGLIIRDQLIYDRFIPGYERTYLVSTIAIPKGHPALYQPLSPSWTAEHI